MPLAPRLFPGDEELGKKDDDHRPQSRRSFSMNWQHRQAACGPHPRTMKRMAITVVVLLALYYFIKNIPTDLENPRPRPNYDHSKHTQLPHIKNPNPVRPADQSVATDSPARGETEPQRHDFNGPIRFYNLATTLQPYLKHKGPSISNKNVVSVSSCILYLYTSI